MIGLGMTPLKIFLFLAVQIVWRIIKASPIKGDRVDMGIKDSSTRFGNQALILATWDKVPNIEPDNSRKV